MKVISYSNCTLLAIFYLIVLASCQGGTQEPDPFVSARAYHISNNGNDDHDGSRQYPWKSFVKIKDMVLKPGDSVLLHGGESFTGTLMLHDRTAGTATKPVVIGSYGTGKATINSGHEKGMIINNSSHILLQQLRVLGAGRKEGNVTDGVSIISCDHIIVDSLEISGYQKSGLLVRNCSNTTIQNVLAHNNGYAGISVNGKNHQKTDNRNIRLLYCRAENNPGDPTGYDNHSGNGIVVSQCTNTRIAYCTATNNGWDMPRIGNGPVGIWAWEADSVVIEHCLSYRNKTSRGGEDGGGFDLDGGITNSTIQYCLSYENHGSGIGLFQYNHASPWNNNTIRYNISINDGAVSAAKAGIYIWNASYEHMLKNCFIYNNTIYNSKNAAINYAVESANEGFVFYNNILVGKQSIIAGDSIRGKYLGNAWWSIKDGFNVGGKLHFTNWATTNQQELLHGTVAGLNINPRFPDLENIKITDARMLPSFSAAKAGVPLLVTGGINLRQLFTINTGGKDFNGAAAPEKGIGASF